jgi:ribose transport system substrate-binding protein
MQHAGTRHAFFALCIGALALASACGKEQPEQGPGTPGGPPASKPLRIAFVTNNAADYWTIARKGCEQAQRELSNVSVEFRIPADGTAAEQKRIFDDLLAAGIDGIAISPVDPANQTQMLDEAAKQVPVLTQDSDAPTSKRLAYIGTDNVAAGRLAGELLRRALPAGGKVMVFVGNADAQNAAERYQGLKAAVEGSQIRILGLVTDGTDRVRAKANVSDTLVRHPDIAGLVGLWAYNGPAILSAVVEAGMAGKVRIVAFDEEDATLAGVRDGTIEASVVQQPYEFGRRAITLLASYLRGDRSAIPPDGRIIVPTIAVRKDNVDSFMQQLNVWRGRAAQK